MAPCFLQGLSENLSPMQDLLGDVVEAVLQAYPSQSALLAQPCRDNILYLLALVDELVMKDAVRFLPVSFVLGRRNPSQDPSLAIS